MLLSVIFILLGRSYPFIPIHLSLISGTAIGLPSFLLTLEQTESVTQNGFLKHVLRISLPGALTMVVDMLLIQLLGTAFGFDESLISMYNLLAAGMISMLVLISVCRPMNRKREALCIICIVLFVGAILLFPGFLSIHSIFVWRTIFIVPLCLLTLIIMNSLLKLLGYIVESVNEHQKAKSSMA